MANIPLIALCVASALSVAALVVAGLSLWNARKARRNSEDAQHHTQIVSFGQRKQEIRQIIFETQLLLGESNNELNRVERELPRVNMNEADRAYISKNTSNFITVIAGVYDKQQACLRDLIDIPASPSTDARLTLEQVGGIANQLNAEYLGSRLVF